MAIQATVEVPLFAKVGDDDIQVGTLAVPVRFEPVHE